MRDFDDSPIRLYRGPGWFAVVFISLLTSCAAVIAYHWAIRSGVIPGSLLTTSSAETSAAASAAATVPPQGNTATVPLLAGFPLSSALELARERGLEISVRERRTHDQLPKDAIITQEPLPNTVVQKSSTIHVVLSTGPTAPVALPELAGKTREQAAALLQQAKLTPTWMGSVEADQAVVASTEPAAGSELAEGANVNVTLALPTKEVPKLVGLRWGKAKKVLEESGFELGKLRERFDEFHAGWIILQQSPAPGEQAPVGSAIDVVRNEAD